MPIQDVNRRSAEYMGFKISDSSREHGDTHFKANCVIVRLAGGAQSEWSPMTKIVDAIRLMNKWLDNAPKGVRRDAQITINRRTPSSSVALLIDNPSKCVGEYDSESLHEAITLAVLQAVESEELNG